ncbi:hypothetical protein MUK42_36219 [Musa troglodytarum]|uniref:Uncharacterized protein n=1 Tax=Musa troglodytarum TaxID=320322 RepID=A0A9E7GPB2_9LILI|nr:hypothetical protein MUK42_36219 [Musa troglodytarum]
MGSSEEERLVQMVHDFMESDAPPPPPTTPTTIGATSLHQQTLLLLEGILGDNTHAEMEVFDKALKHVRDAGDERKRSKVKKRLMMRLRMDGYDASLCRSSWVATMECPGGDASRFCPAEAEGDYEFIDIVMVDGNGVSTRILIDIDFRSQFELARPTSAYTQLSSTLPPIFVGKEEKLKKVVSLLCSAAQQSLRERGLHIPPWRRSSYMQAKWLSCCQKASTIPYTSSSIQDIAKLKGRHASTKSKGRDAESKGPKGSALSSQFSHLSINCC